MARSRYRIVENEYPYFMTCTVNGWLPVFTRTEAVDVIFNSWRYLQREQDFKLLAYVVLENHLHLVASAPNLSDVMRNFKSFTARQIIDLLDRHFAADLLQQFEFLKARHKVESDYQFWQEGNHPEQIRTDAMMWQKLEYIHNNPVKRGYIDDPVHWRYSSARNYAKQPALIDVITDWM